VKRLLLAACLCASAVQAEEFTFDASAFEKKPFEFGGYLELTHERMAINRSSSFARLNGVERDRLDRDTATLKLNAKYSHGSASVNLKGSASAQRDALTSARDTHFDEAYLSFKPDPGFTLDLGKQALKWGKGYAWNPIGFVERPKDPNDVELAREGYTLLAADFIRHFDGDLKAIAFTPVLLPVNDQTNRDFGAPNHLNAAAKLYLLWYDTDIDFAWLSRGSRTPRFGIDFSRNLSSNFEIHGEWARIRDFTWRFLDAAGNVRSETRAVTSYLLGLRYLTENDTTWIAELYHNGAGLTESQIADFHALVDSGNKTLFDKALQLSPAYARPTASRDYFYLKVSQKEPFDIVYFTPSLTLMTNLGDRSWSLTPELLYTGITNLDLRLRITWLRGREHSEFGEKQNESKIEFRARLYF
jgi:hypothetical protein